MTSYFQYDMGQLDKEVAALMSEEERHFRRERDGKMRDIEQILQEVGHLSRQHVEKGSRYGGAAVALDAEEDKEKAADGQRVMKEFEE